MLVAAGPGATVAHSPLPGAVEVEFASGARLRLMGPVDASTVRVMVTALGAKVQRRCPSGVQVWLATGHKRRDTQRAI